MKRIFFLWMPVFSWSLLIFYLSSLPLKPPAGNIFFDLVLPNLAHLGEYGVLFVLLWRASKKMAISFLLSTLYAFSDEFHQLFVPTRTASLIDILVDIFGMIIAWLIIWKFLPKAAKRLKTWAKNWQIL